MGMRNREKNKKQDLLELSDSERVLLIKRVREKLRQKIVEAKFLQSLAEAENVTINGDLVHSVDSPLKGFSFAELVKNAQ